MIYLKDLLVDVGIVSEGVNKTHDIDKCLPILDRRFSTEDYRMFFSKTGDNKILVKFEHNNPKINIDLKKRDVEYLLLTMTSLGYHPSHYNTVNLLSGWKKYNEGEVEKILNLKDGNGLGNIVFDASHDDRIIDDFNLPDVLYHITPTIYKEKIEKIGLTPRSKNKFENHPERIYFVLNIEGVKKLLSNNKFIINNDTKQPYDSLTIFKFDLKSYKNHTIKVHFCNDPSFKEYGLFTTDNIHPKYLQAIRVLTYSDGSYKE